MVHLGLVRLSVLLCASDVSGSLHTQLTYLTLQIRFPEENFQPRKLAPNCTVPSRIPDLTAGFGEPRQSPPPPQHLFHQAQGAAPSAPRPAELGAPPKKGDAPAGPICPPRAAAPPQALADPRRPDTHPLACAPAPLVPGSPKLPLRPPRGFLCSPAALRSASNAAPREGSEPPAGLPGQQGVRSWGRGGCSSRHPARGSALSLAAPTGLRAGPGRARGCRGRRAGCTGAGGGRLGLAWPRAAPAAVFCLGRRAASRAGGREPRGPGSRRQRPGLAARGRPPGARSRRGARAGTARTPGTEGRARAGARLEAAAS